jgi:hypothetical protein
MKSDNSFAPTNEHPVIDIEVERLMSILLGISKLGQLSKNILLNFGMLRRDPSKMFNVLEVSFWLFLSEINSSSGKAFDLLVSWSMELSFISVPSILNCLRFFNTNKLEMNFLKAD